MQFVRRQRLSDAMEKLQTADLDDTVTTIARDMGYRYTSNFTNDFQRAFGVKPSAVLRSSRGGGGRKHVTDGGLSRQYDSVELVATPSGSLRPGL